MGKGINKANISEAEREKLITKLTDELFFLRTKLGLSQEELSEVLGVSRQTYSTIETKRRMMSWGMYLSLVLIFDNSAQTHSIVRESGIYPYMLFGTNENSDDSQRIADISGFMIEDIKGKLDNQALHTIETVVMLEYARCNRMSGDDVLKSFDGRRLTKPTGQEIAISNAINAIKR